jgi:transposase
LAYIKALHLLAGAGAQQQGLGRTPAQLPDPPSANRAGTILRRCAMSLARTSTALGAFYRRLAARIGKAKAITATARKLAVLVYRARSGDLIYNDPGAAAYHQLNRARELKSLRKRAKFLGFDLLNHSTGELLLPPVS